MILARLCNKWKQYSSKQINYERMMFPGGEVNFVLDVKDMMAYDKVRISVMGIAVHARLIYLMLF